MKNGGKLAILVIILVASVLGSFGWLWHAAHGQKVLEAWGSDSAMAIRHGTKVERLLLSPDAAAVENGEGEDSAKSLDVGGDTLWIDDARDITGVYELNHYQRALADDYSYEWDAEPSEVPPRWTHALRFEYKGDRKTIAFDFSGRRAFNVEKGVPLRLEEKTAGALETFLSRHDDDAPKPTAPPS
ncbi:MAG: hypothetical protein RIC55_16830 [Pirellulaceae bacterium]